MPSSMTARAPRGGTVVSYAADDSLSRRGLPWAVIVTLFFAAALAGSSSLASPDGRVAVPAFALLADAGADATSEPAPPNPPPAPDNPPPSPAPGGEPPAPGATPPAGTPPPAPPSPPGVTPPEGSDSTPPPAPAKPPKPPPRAGDVETMAGLQALQVGDLASARLHFEKALAVDPGHPVARSRVGYLKFRV